MKSKMEWLMNLFAPKPPKYQEERLFLELVTAKDVDLFTLKGHRTWAKVVKNYDGDSVHLVLFYHSTPYRFRADLYGIETAKYGTHDPREKQWAIRARERLNELIDQKLVFVVCHEWDAFGRLLVEMYDTDNEANNDALKFNDVLVGEGLAYRYEGRVKPFKEWAPPMAFDIECTCYQLKNTHQENSMKNHYLHCNCVDVLPTIREEER